MDERDGAFSGEAKVKWYHGPEECGSGGHALWTYTTTDKALSENTARWQPKLAEAGTYEVFVFVPKCATPKNAPATGSARYRVQHSEGIATVSVDQTQGGTWVSLGRFTFDAGNEGFVEVTDVAGDSMRALWIDAARWARVP